MSLIVDYKLAMCLHMLQIIGLANSDDHTVLLWTPINTSRIQLRIHEYVLRGCIGINFYGCTSSEGLWHLIDTLAT